jgi:hypothetical protein
MKMRSALLVILAAAIASLAIVGCGASKDEDYGHPVAKPGTLKTPPGLPGMKPGGK